MRKSDLKILLVCIVNRNYGDSVIADCTEYLIKKALGKSAGENTILRYKIDCGDLWQIRFADAVVFAGGGLMIFRQEQFYAHVCEIIEEAERVGVPVFMNAVGVEGFDEEDERCTMLREHVNLSCVKAVTVRDDNALMKEKYKVRPDLRVKGVFDPAVWARDVYGENAESSDVVGLNVARAGLFPDYGNPELDEEYMLAFWEDTIKLLEEKGMGWKVFTNGGKGDEEFASKLMERVGRGEKLPAPRSAEAAVRNIRRFSSLIALRMHACITAAAFGIPCVGMVWNDKLRMWSEKIGAPELYLKPDSVNAETVVKTLLEAIDRKPVRLGFFRKYGVYREIKRFIGKYAVNRGESSSELSGKLFEVGLGGIQHRLKAPNSLGELERRLKEGCRFFEADVRADTQGKAVCINGWSDKNLRLLGIEPPAQPRKEQPIDEVRKSLIEGAFTAGGLEEAVEMISRYSGVRLILDVGLPPADLKEALFEDIAAILKDHGLDIDDTYIRLQREGDVKLWAKQNCDSTMIYFYPDDAGTEESREKQQKALSVCKKYGIKYISTSERNFTDDTARIMKEKKLLPVVFSYEKLGDAAAAAERGASMIGSFYYSSCYAKKLTARIDRS